MSFLGEDDLRKLTGKQRPSAVRRALLAMGYKFEVRADGWPVVMWRQVEDRQRGTTRTQRRTPRWDRLEVGHATAAEEGVPQG